jgi:transposase
LGSKFYLDTIEIFMISRLLHPLAGFSVSKIRAGDDEMVGRRHASEEIATKLAQANDLAAKGKTQREISKALGVSIMTYHRWKKTPNPSMGGNESSGRGKPEGRPEPSRAMNTDEMVRHLEVENAQLRRLVTDMLLEKLRLEEMLRTHEPRFRRLDKTK